MKAPLGDHVHKRDGHVQLLGKRDDCWGHKHNDYEGGYYEVNNIGAFGSEVYAVWYCDLSALISLFDFIRYLIDLDFLHTDMSCKVFFFMFQVKQNDVFRSFVCLFVCLIIWFFDKLEVYRNENIENQTIMFKHGNHIFNFDISNDFFLSFSIVI